MIFLTKPLERISQLSVKSVIRHAPMKLIRALALILLGAVALSAPALPQSNDLAPTFEVYEAPIEAVPIIQPPMRYLRIVDDGIRSNLARCAAAGRPLCDTGMICLGWIEVEFTIAPDGGVEDVVTVNRCPDQAPPEDPWARVREWEYNPRIRDGEAVPTRASTTLAYSLGVSS
jgi:hypothetical protein